MTYLFFSAQYLPTVGGVERYTNQLALELKKQGCRVLIATSENPGQPEREMDGDGLEIFRFPALPLMNGRFPVPKPGGRFRRLAKALWAEKPDRCVINTYFYPLSLYAAWAARRRGIPAVVVNHGSAWLMVGSPLARLAGRVYERLSARLAYRLCGRIYGVSQAACDWLENFSIPPAGIITNAVNPEALPMSETCWREKLGLSPAAPVIAFAGRLIPEKGVFPLAEALDAIREKVPDARLVLAGDGPLLETLRTQNREGLHLLGAQPYEETLALIQQADIFCLPSRSEGFACTVLEAAALGTPVVTTRTGGSPQLLADERYGLLLPEASKEAIAEACVRALSDGRWRETAGALARRRLLENFTWNRAAAQLAEAFRSDNEKCGG